MNKKIIIIIGIIAILVGLYFWLRFTINQNTNLEKLRGDLKILENEKHNLKIDNEALERDIKSAEDELEIYGNGKG